MSSKIHRAVCRSPGRLWDLQSSKIGGTSFSKRDKNSSKPEFKQYKILILGDLGVGKTSLMLRYMCDEFSTERSVTVPEERMTKILNIEDTTIKLQLWDTVGQELFRSTSSSYHRNTNGVVFVFDLSNADTLKNLEKWNTDVDIYCPKEIEKVLVGAKSDLPRAVKQNAITEYSETMKIPYIETSSLNNANVSDVFLNLATRLKNNIYITPILAPVTTVSITKSEKKKIKMHFNLKWYSWHLNFCIIFL